MHQSRTTGVATKQKQNSFGSLSNMSAAGAANMASFKNK